MCFLMAKADSARTNASQVSSCGGEGYFTRPKPCLPPKSCMPSTVSALHLFKPRSADHRILRDDLCELLLRPTGRLGWLYRQHHVAVISRGPNTYLRDSADVVFGKIQRCERRRLVPRGRRSLSHRDRGLRA